MSTAEGLVIGRFQQSFDSLIRSPSMHRSLSLLPPSPPISPFMSGIPAKFDGSYWQYSTTRPPPTPLDQAQQQQSYPQQYSYPSTVDRERPLLRTVESYGHSSQYSARSSNETFAPSATRSSTFANSVPTSPSHLNPRSPALERDRITGDRSSQDADGTEQDEEELEDDGDDAPLTAEQRLQQKRKMKRFRLTHNQTRYLMSEFANQAHPDAAHRERLSREIPGLSPRQVQVWFQNRRAKLKRLTADDRDRMVKSRQLPADFDMASAMHHPPHGMQAPMPGGGLPPITGYNSYASQGGIRPLAVDTLRRVPEYEQYGQQSSYASPSTGLTPAMSSYSFAPAQSGPGPISPTPTSGPPSGMPTSYGYPSQDGQRGPSMPGTGQYYGRGDVPISPPPGLPYASSHVPIPTQVRSPVTYSHPSSFNDRERRQPVGIPVQPDPTLKGSDQWRRDGEQNPETRSSYSQQSAPHLPSPHAQQYPGYNNTYSGSEGYHGGYAPHHGQGH